MFGKTCKLRDFGIKKETFLGLLYLLVVKSRIEKLPKVLHSIIYRIYSIALYPFDIKCFIAFLHFNTHNKKNIL